MGTRRSEIGWTDFSGGWLNFVMRGTDAGDCEASPGCDHCYARRILERVQHASAVTTVDAAKLERLARADFKENGQPFRRGAGLRPMAFVCGMGDLFHREASDALILRALDIFADRRDVDWQLLTKRGLRMERLALIWCDTRGRDTLPPNVWCGVSVENQDLFDARVATLLCVPAEVRFLSVEPMLGPIRFTDAQVAGISWLVVGAESGPGRRPFDVAWARDVRDLCFAMGIPYFFKQDSGPRSGLHAVIDGAECKQWPA